MLRHDISNKLNKFILQYNGLFGTWQMLSHTLTWHFLCKVVKREGLLSGMNVKYAPDLFTFPLSEHVCLFEEKSAKMCSKLTMYNVAKL